MKVKKWVTQDFPMVEESATVRECLHRMRQYQTNECIVKDREGHFRGVVNKEDLLDLDLDSSVFNKVSLPDFFVHEEDNITHALLLFLEHQEPYLPVVDEEMRLKGAVSLHDFLEALIEALAMDVPGIRFSVLLEDKPGELRKVVDALALSNINILSVITTRSQDGKREVLIKVDAVDEGTLIKLFESLGIKIESIEKEEGF
ncbi:CBS domain containing protein [Thermotoga petrophila RKU-1]|uniref:CBS domain containing protein n=2 Tax=Thermotoga TaxID=2335 RepID=A5IIP1_THEP1|nr:CBS domain-containing protein [Thermotoga petrophila]ABQ46064.1 CBS domain containing protein [Thermotoga petrophila RKU-1]